MIVAAPPTSVKAALDAFLTLANQPVAIEPGEPPYPLRPDAFAIEETRGAATLQVWDDGRVLVRRLVRVTSTRRGRLEFETERFGKRRGTLTVADRAIPAYVPLDRQAARLELVERLRTMLARQFPGWHMEGPTHAPDLEHSLSPAFPRAMVRRGSTAWAAIAAADDNESADNVLTYGLLWLHYLRLRERRLLVEGLAILLPFTRRNTTLLRTGWLHPRAVRVVLFADDGSGVDIAVDPADRGNLDTQLHPATGGVRSVAAWRAGMPEADLERVLRRSIQVLDPDLDPEPVYGQISSWAGAERGILDLLAVDHRGRLAVIELKAAPEPNLPLQALDYWMRVRWHNEQGDLPRHGYFPGRAILPEAPRLLLAAPSLAFHPTSEALLSFLAPEIEVERIGLIEGEAWRTAFRLRRAERPY